MEKKKRDLKYLIETLRPNDQLLNRHLIDIDDRISDLEEKVFKNPKKAELTRAQKDLLLIELGVIDFLHEKGYSQKSISKIISVLINADLYNIEKDLGKRFEKNSSLKSRNNYQTIKDFCKELKINEVDDLLDTILEKMPDDE
jgi:hypothetical protein